MSPEGASASSGPIGWAEMPPARAEARVRTWPSVVLPLLAASVVVVVLFLHGRTIAAGVLLLVVATLTVVRRSSPSMDRRVGRALDRIGRAVGHVLRVVLLGVIYAVFFVPIAVIAAFTRSPALGGEPGAAPAWMSRDQDQTRGRPMPKRGFGPEPRWRRSHRSPLGVVCTALVVLVLVDVLAGSLLTSTGLMPPVDRGDVYRLEHARPEAESPAFGGAPWAGQLMGELIDFQADQYAYTPYIQHTYYPYESDYINTTDTERLSYQPALADGQQPLRIAFFGGSVIFGIGQRDLHTIPSAFARIAEEQGVPVEVHNFGFPRWVSWQEMLYFERMLARHGPFDLAIFLDGYNEFYTQAQSLSYDPTFHAAAATGLLIDDFRAKHATQPTFLDSPRELVDSYRRSSAIWRIADRLTGREAGIFGQASARVGSPAEQADAALDIYRRSTEMIADLGDSHGTPYRFFWQPQADGWDPSVIARLPPSVTDLSQAFDGRQDLYIDPVHTNEEGARILAQAMWDSVAADLQARPAAARVDGG